MLGTWAQSVGQRLGMMLHPALSPSKIGQHFLWQKLPTEDDNVCKAWCEGPKLSLEVISDKPSKRAQLHKKTISLHAQTYKAAFSDKLADVIVTLACNSGTHLGSQNESMNFSGNLLCQSVSNITPTN